MHMVYALVSISQSPWLVSLVYQAIVTHKLNVNGACSLANEAAVQMARADTATRTTYLGTPVCRLCGRYLAILGRPKRVTIPAVTVAPTALVGSLIRSSNLPHSLQRGVHTYVSPCGT